MRPRMSSGEIALFESFLRSSRIYLEFGSGGSTLLASQMVSEAVISTDSSQAWLDAVASACEKVSTRIKPLLIFANIGPVGEWGYPTGGGFSASWPNYYTKAWDIPESQKADLCLVDGRFRVASFTTTMLRCSDRTFIMIHDFGERLDYHVVTEFAEEIARADTLSVFRRKLSFDAARALSILESSRVIPH